MRRHGFLRDQNGSAVRWFAYAAAAITIVAAVGAHGMAWLAQSGREPLQAFLPLNRPAAHSFGDPDMAATGSIPARPPVASRP